MYVPCVCVRVRARLCVLVCVRVRVCACVPYLTPLREDSFYTDSRNNDNKREALHKRNTSFAYLNENGIGYVEFNVKNK